MVDSKTGLMDYATLNSFWNEVVNTSTVKKVVKGCFIVDYWIKNIILAVGWCLLSKVMHMSLANHRIKITCKLLVWYVFKGSVQKSITDKNQTGMSMEHDKSVME